MELQPPFTNNILVDSGRTVIKLMISDENKISCDGLFKDIPEIKKIVFKNFNICNSAIEMFSGCSNLEELNLKSFDTSEITNMNGMFSGCSNLETLEVSSFDISKSEDVENMFCSCEKLNDVNKKLFKRTSFKCVNCENPNPFLIEYSNQCVANCSDTTNYKYLLEEEKICVEDCKETDYKFFIDGYFENWFLNKYHIRLDEHELRLAKAKYGVQVQDENNNNKVNDPEEEAYKNAKKKIQTIHKAKKAEKKIN